MNEIDLIREVEKKPILYDKSVSGFNKTKLRDDAWKEVQEALNVSEAECKKRWRSLRDSFIKLQRTHGGKTRWPYHQAMRFLLPHVDPAAARMMEEPGKNREDDSDPEDACIPLRSLPEISYSISLNPHKIAQYSAEDDEDEDSQSSTTKKPRLNSTEDENGGCKCNRTDPDELFLLSCASTLKRLNSKQNAVARLKIQKVLFEAEFGIPGGTACVTPSGDCGLEPIEGAEDA